ncbi:hypothetical protein Esi_0318_0021 [Ectocarpus siliculosus]|uniref:Uncharacterized protein n=1 Tax=Ectocarpus siliculosus TaxID=2880 RepID=D7FWY1_ECTSI|nr:hypothetical protein Esi_0318_0021 [Ectocarpus siliculosus]|eukprot:CBJ32219.1 hypothetical protein Esi_0318_0021 [Ectocarpus siliculosus]
MRRIFMPWSKELPKALVCSAYHVRQIWRRGVIWTTAVRTAMSPTRKRMGFGKEKQKKTRDRRNLYEGFQERILVGLKPLLRGHMFVAVCPWSGCCWLGYLDQEKDADAMATFLRDVVLREVEGIKGSWTPTPEDRSNPDSGEVSMGITEKHGSVFKVLERSLVSARARDQGLLHV